MLPSVNTWSLSSSKHYGLLEKKKKMMYFAPSNRREKRQENTLLVNSNLNDYQSPVMSKFKVKVSYYLTS